MSRAVADGGHRRPSLFASSTHKTFVTQLTKVRETGTTRPLFATAPQYSDTLLGAAYLIYLGVGTLLRPVEPQEVDGVAPRKLSRLFAHGFLVNLLNPKAALCFMAFLPQFVVPGRGSTLLQVLFLGGLFTALAVLTDSPYALAAGTVRRHLSMGQGIARLRRNLSGFTYIGLGLLAALAGTGRK